jgi:hypothetical protein
MANGSGEINLIGYGTLAIRKKLKRLLALSSSYNPGRGFTRLRGRCIHLYLDFSMLYSSAPSERFNRVALQVQ